MIRRVVFFMMVFNTFVGELAEAQSFKGERQLGLSCQFTQSKVYYGAGSPEAKVIRSFSEKIEDISHVGSVYIGESNSGDPDYFHTATIKSEGDGIAISIFANNYTFSPRVEVPMSIEAAKAGFKVTLISEMYTVIEDGKPLELIYTSHLICKP